MKKWIIVTLVLMSSVLLAHKIVIYGKPVVLKANGSYYSFPDIYPEEHGYHHGFHYVFVGGTNRVCYLHLKPELAALDMLRIHMEAVGKKFYWYCYAYNKDFFELDF